MNQLFFKPVSNFKRGILFELLSKSYSKFVNNDKLLNKVQYINNWKSFDDEVFDNVNTIGKCVFVTCIENEIIGFASYDPRKIPEIGIIGHNVILPLRRRKGYGKAQIFEIIKIFKKKKYKKISVTTGESNFFKSSQKMYISCGFKEIKRFYDNKLGFRKIEYKLII